jgi:acyl-coenzyme A synthetase/AMP-(fatty) acid ligase
MDKLFLVIDGQGYTYKDFMTDISSREHCSPYVYVKNNHPYTIFLSIVHSIVHRYAIVVVDGDFSRQELEELGLDVELLDVRIEGGVQARTIDDLPKTLRAALDDSTWTLTLYTSGTTGRPKSVRHTLKSLTRNVKVDERFANDRWAFSYNPTHMAGIQVFFQVLFNQNMMVYSFDGRQKHLPDDIFTYQLTNLSATATYYRSLLPALRDNQYSTVKRVTFGGEKYDVTLESKLRQVFPNAQIRNIYASTEAGSLFTAIGDNFKIPSHIRDAVRISEEGELIVHKSLLGDMETIESHDNWYSTGDLVEWIGPEEFRFVSRQSDMINVGGYKVNPLEVEHALSEVPGIVDMHVRAMQNRVTGQLLVVDVIKSDEFDDMELKKAIKQQAASCLQPWKIPRIINFVDELPRTRTGKKARK